MDYIVAKNENSDFFEDKEFVGVKSDNINFNENKDVKSTQRMERLNSDGNFHQMYDDHMTNIYIG